MIAECEYILVDIDGTLSDMKHRLHMVDTNNGNSVIKDWEKFHAAAIDDKVNEWCKKLVNVLHENYLITLITGRPENNANITRKWLEKYYIKYDCLLMRKAKDFREDYIVKKELYETYVKPYCYVAFVIEDRKQVVDMWRKEGLVCLQCADGNF